MDWMAEADAVIEDVKLFVSDIRVATNQESSDMRIFFEIVTLEKEKMIVAMDASGYTILECESQSDTDLSDNYVSQDAMSNKESRVYETINALLDDRSTGYRNAFALALLNKIKSIDNERDA